jgi:hypothetical protein
MPSWNTDGNRGTDPTKDFLGTTDNQPLAIRTNEAERMRLTGNGNVGIGTTNPGANKLDVHGDVAILGKHALHGNLPEDWLHLNDKEAFSAGVYTRGLFAPDSLNVGGIGAWVAPPAGTLIAFNVGIGTAQPGARLEINNGDLLLKAAEEDPGDIVFENSGGTQKGRIWSNPGAGAGLFLSNGDNNPDISINAAGNVGIGTPAPGARLTVDVPGSSSPISALSVDVQSFGTPANARASHYFRVRDIGAAPPEGLTHFLIRGDGNVEVAGDIRLLNADCAEDFDVSRTEEVDPGPVVVIDQEGAMQQARRAYDKRVAGVISGAGEYRSGIILDNRDGQADRMPVALMGKVCCKVDAQYSPIEVGDLLTTSPTPGHGMKANDPLRASGAVFGKALRPLEAGTGVIPALVALQ